MDRVSFLVPHRTASTPRVPRLFSASLHDNLLLGSPDDGALKRAVATAALEPDVAAMERGLDTSIGSRGVRLICSPAQPVAVGRSLVPQAQPSPADALSPAPDA